MDIHKDGKYSVRYRISFSLDLSSFLSYGEVDGCSYSALVSDHQNCLKLQVWIMIRGRFWVTKSQKKSTKQVNLRKKVLNKVKCHSKKYSKK